MEVIDERRRKNFTRDNAKNIEENLQRNENELDDGGKNINNNRNHNSSNNDNDNNKIDIDVINTENRIEICNKDSECLEQCAKSSISTLESSEPNVILSSDNDNSLVE